MLPSVLSLFLASVWHGLKGIATAGNLWTFLLINLHNSPQLLFLFFPFPFSSFLPKSLVWDISRPPESLQKHNTENTYLNPPRLISYPQSTWTRTREWTQHCMLHWRVSSDGIVCPLIPLLLSYDLIQNIVWHLIIILHSIFLDNVLALQPLAFQCVFPHYPLVL